MTFRAANLSTASRKLTSTVILSLLGWKDSVFLRYYFVPRSLYSVDELTWRVPPGRANSFVSGTFPRVLFFRVPSYGRSPVDNSTSFCYFTPSRDRAVRGLIMRFPTRKNDSRRNETIFLLFFLSTQFYVDGSWEEDLSGHSYRCPVKKLFCVVTSNHFIDRTPASHGRHSNSSLSYNFNLKLISMYPESYNTRALAIFREKLYSWCTLYSIRYRTRSTLWRELFLFHIAWL